MEIFWLELSRLKYRDFFEKITKSESKNIIFTPNPEILLAAKKNEEYKKILQQADYLIPDWIGIYAGLQIIENARYWKLFNIFAIPYYWFKLFTSRKNLYKKYGERICGSDLTKDLLIYANEKKIWVVIIDLFFEPKTKWDYLKLEAINNTIPKLKEKYPNIEFHQFIYKEENIGEIIEKINETNSVYLFSTLWAIKQEKSIINLVPKLDKIKIAAWIGGSIDFLIWFKKRAPRIFVKLWIEWLWRLFINPNRMIKRIWNAIFVFLWEVVRSV